MKHQPVKQGQTTRPGTSCPTLCEKCVGFLTSPADHNSEDAGDGAYGLSSLSVNQASFAMATSNIPVIIVLITDTRSPCRFVTSA